MCAFVYVGVSDCIAGGLLQKVCSVASQAQIPKHTRFYIFALGDPSSQGLYRGVTAE